MVRAQLMLVWMHEGQIAVSSGTALKEQRSEVRVLLLSVQARPAKGCGQVGRFPRKARSPPSLAARGVPAPSHLDGLCDNSW